MSQVEWNIGAGSKVVPVTTPTTPAVAPAPKAKKSKVKVTVMRLNMVRDPKLDEQDRERGFAYMSKKSVARCNKY